MELQDEMPLTDVNETEFQDLEVRSRASMSGSARAASQHGSTCSSTKSAMLAAAKAKAQAARTRAAYSEEEMAIKLQKAKLEAELEALQCREEMKAAIAEAAALQAELGDDQSLGELGSEVNQRYFLERDLPPKHEVKLENNTALPNLRSPSMPPAQSSPQPSPAQPPIETPQPLKQHMPHADTYRKPLLTSSKAWQGVRDYTLPSPAPHTALPNHSPDLNEHSSPTADLAKFIVRSQLVSTGLTKFDDRAENYWAWKASFCNTIDNIGLTVGEETNLLIK